MDEQGFSRPEEIDTSNYQLVGMQGSEIIVMKPKIKMTQDEALLHAAWLVALSEKSFKDFQKVYEAVCNV